MLEYQTQEYIDLRQGPPNFQLEAHINYQAAVKGPTTYLSSKK